jgi:hydroxylamine reductase
VLLALLALGFKNIRLGPTLPAFLTPVTAKLLTAKFNLQSINDPADDITAMLAGA